MTDTTQDITKNIENVKEALQLENIQTTAVDPILQQWAGFIGFLPKIITAGITLLVGLIIAYVLSKVTATLLKRFGIDKMGRSAGVNDMMSERGLTNRPSKLVGKVVFWLVAFTAFIPATKLLGIKELVEITQTFVLFLPKLIIAIIIVVIGLVIANALRKNIANSESRLGLTSTKTVGNLVYGLTAAVTVVVALNQLELDTRLLHTVLITFIASICAAIALAVGLGGRDLAHNLLAGFYARESFKPDQRMTFGEYDGKLVEVRAQNTVIELNSGEQVSIPNSHLFQHTVKSDGS
uniref:Small-conductance mechanosensitive channel n=1 Tax=uncultured Thiotrichaceae bacterium TaxID=298394 RepID=A0A6S6TQT5_9GAMM|nr:MAG: Unknown protein [uncultured Thiotrichaceae bacterium]